MLQHVHGVEVRDYSRTSRWTWTKKTSTLVLSAFCEIAVGQGAALETGAALEQRAAAALGQGAAHATLRQTDATTNRSHVVVANAEQYLLDR